MCPYGHQKLNRRVMEKLIMSGAFDRLGPHRAALMSSLEDALKAADQHAKAEAIGQADMFGVLAEAPEQVERSYANIPKWQDEIILEGERETLGLYLTGHPINRYLKEIERYTHGLRLKDVNPTPRGQMTTVVGLVLASKVITTKRETGLVSVPSMIVPAGWKLCYFPMHWNVTSICSNRIAF